MTENKKEIQIKAVKVEDSKIGPRIGICDMSGAWYNSNKKAWEKHPEAWETLSRVQRGSRLDLVWEVRSYPKKDGTTGYSNEIVSFDPVIQRGDEVVRAPEAPSLPGETKPIDAPRQEWSPKQTCLNSAVSIVVALWNTGQIPKDIEEDILARAKRLYNGLKEAW